MHHFVSPNQREEKEIMKSNANTPENLKFIQEDLRPENIVQGIGYFDEPVIKPSVQHYDVYFRAGVAVEASSDEEAIEKAIELINKGQAGLVEVFDFEELEEWNEE